jgi:3-(3-hydroxy-phenyl)propionate hydroxylase
VTVDGKRDWFLRHVGGRFVALRFADRATPRTGRVSGVSAPPCGQAFDTLPRIDPLLVAAPSSDSARDKGALIDIDGMLAARYDAQPGTTYLLRPDQHVCARWRHYDAGALHAAAARAICNG